MKAEFVRMARQVIAIATITFQELLREKVLWSAFIFAALCVGLAYAVSQLSFAENARIALNFGLTSISIVGGLISIIMGAGLVAREVQNRTLYLVLTKSIWRWQFVVGRLAGLLAVLSLNSAVMMIIMVIVFALMGGSVEFSLLKSFILQIVEFGVIASVACIFSVFSTATMAAIFSSGVWIIGHAMTDLKILISRVESPTSKSILSFIAGTLPDLTRFDIKAQVAHQIPVTWTYTMVSIVYGMAYIAFALVAACLIFRKRDL
jgi:ABC-type transport system involved in multi-copper enzyme maturation permease subunit